MDEDLPGHERALPGEPETLAASGSATSPLEGSRTDQTLTAKPGRPLLEAGLVFAAFWLTAYIPGSVSAAGLALADPLRHLAMAVELLPKALLLLYIMARSDGLASFGGLSRPRAGDLLGAIVVAAGAFVAVLLPSALLTMAATAMHRQPLINPLLGAVVHPSAPPLLLLPAVILSCLCVGYTEELFFRIYFLRRLGQAGLRPRGAGVASVILFASAHGAQGALGLLMAAVLGAWFTWRRREGAGIHELGLGHALYDSVVIIATLYLRP